MTRQSWDATSIALALYAERKSLTRTDIAKLFDASIGSVNSLFSRMKNRSGYGKKIIHNINKAEQLAFQVQSGLYPEQRELWNKKLTAVTGITYRINGEYPSPEILDPEPPVEEEVTETTPLSSPSVIFSINITDQFLLELVRAWRGK